MAKRKVHLGSKNFFTMTVLSVAALFTLVMANSFLQQQTQTQSEAACGAAPTLLYTGKNSYHNRNVFYFTLKNNCPGYNSFKLRVPEEPTYPYKWNAEWIWLAGAADNFVCSKYNRASDGNNCYVEGVKGSKDLKFIVYEPDAVRAPTGTDFMSYVVKAALRSNENLADYAKFNYKLK